MIQLLLNPRSPVSSIVDYVHQKGRLGEMKHSKQAMPSILPSV